MATRSTIWIKNKDNYEGIYCHFDGYTYGLGRTLFENYNTEEKVRELISQGDASYIENTIETSRFYHTWRGEDLHIYKSSHPVMMKYCFEEYNYLFDNGEWYLMLKNKNKLLKEILKDKEWKKF